VQRAGGAIVRCRTVPELFERSFLARAQSEALRFRGADGSWTGITYAELDRLAERLARGLIAKGITRGDRVAIISDSRPEWTLCDIALARVGAVSVPLYHVSTAAECEYVVRHSGARMLIVETSEHLAIGEALQSGSSALKEIVAIEPEPAGDHMTLATLDELGEQIQQADQPLPDIAPDDLFTIIYTSGTTGAPKGCMHTHATYVAAMQMTAAIGAIVESDVSYLYLPLAHVFGREVQSLTLAVGGCLAFFGGDRTNVMEELSIIRPTFFASVPRLYEKIYTLARAKLERGGQGLSCAQLQQLLGARLEGQAVASGFENGACQMVRELFGGRLREAWSGAAPIASEVLEFLFACGVPIYEGYGLTETAAACTLGTRGSVRLGAVGRALPGFKTLIIDHEIRLCGPSLFTGYYRDPQASSAVLDDGWFRTGDLGSIDDDGFLTITGRLKDVIITAGGKNIAPAPLENEVRRSPYVEEIVVVGDRRPHLTALVVPDLAAVQERVDRRSIASETVGGGRQALNAHDLIEEVIAKANESRPRWAQVRSFSLLSAPLSQEYGELTPTGKVRRGVVAERHGRAIDAMYARLTN
jgi:long-chain acyl-CoA synthetase